jgi:hypothetical protein
MARWRVAAADFAGRTNWNSFVAAAAVYGLSEATPKSCLALLTPAAEASGEPWRPVRTRQWTSGRAALAAYCGRWHIENDAYRELRNGWGLEARWRRHDAAAALRR